MSYTNIQNLFGTGNINPLTNAAGILPGTAIGGFSHTYELPVGIGDDERVIVPPPPIPFSTPRSSYAIFRLSLIIQSFTRNIAGDDAYFPDGFVGTSQTQLAPAIVVVPRDGPTPPVLDYDTGFAADPISIPPRRTNPSYTIINGSEDVSILGAPQLPANFRTVELGTFYPPTHWNGGIRIQCRYNIVGMNSFMLVRCLFVGFLHF